TPPPALPKILNPRVEAARRYFDRRWLRGAIEMDRERYDARLPDSIVRSSVGVGHHESARRVNSAAYRLRRNPIKPTSSRQGVPGPRYHRAPEPPPCLGQPSTKPGTSSVRRPTRSTLA